MPDPNSELIYPEKKKPGKEAPPGFGWLWYHYTAPNNDNDLVFAPIMVKMFIDHHLTDTACFSADSTGDNPVWEGSGEWDTARVVRVLPGLVLCPVLLSEDILHMADVGLKIDRPVRAMFYGRTYAKLLENVERQWNYLAQRWGNTYKPELLDSFDLSSAPSPLLRYRSAWTSILEGIPYVHPSVGLFNFEERHWDPAVADLLAYYKTPEGKAVILEMEDAFYHGIYALGLETMKAAANRPLVAY